MSNWYLQLLAGALWCGFALLVVSVHLWVAGWPMQVVVRELQPMYIADLIGMLGAMYGLLFRS